MRYIKALLVFALLFFSFNAFSQFNTVKQVKRRPSVAVDSRTVPAPQPAAAVKQAPQVPMVRQLVALPLVALLVSSAYGSRVDPISGKTRSHQGIDFQGKKDPVRAILPGSVKKAGYSRGMGNYIEVEHGAYTSVYGHLSIILVREKKQVQAGDVIAITGNTGRSTGEHLHFAIRHKGRMVDPTPCLDLIYRTVVRSSKSEAPLTSPQ